MRKKPEPFNLDKDKIAKVLRIEFLIQDKDGQYLKVLEGQEAEKWNEMMHRIYELFSNDPEYPEFHKLKWETMSANPNIFQVLKEIKEENQKQ